jgi:hypothetical protein
MLTDEKLVAAVSHILQRSEKQDDLQKLIYSFVDTGIISLLMNDNNQILYGRRGTGKTHVLKVLFSKLAQDNKNTVVYIDGRVLGSTAQFSDPDLPLRNRVLALFRDFLSPVQNALMSHIVEYPTAQQERAFESASVLADIVVGSQSVVTEETQRLRTSHQGASGGKICIGTEGLQASASARVAEDAEVERERKFAKDDKVILPELHSALSSVLDLANSRLYILFDEWSSIPKDLQPYLAEFIKKSILPLTRAVIKIASLEYRSQFSCTQDNTQIGFELGADISTATELDDYFVFDRNPEGIANIFSEILLRHVAADLADGYLQEHFGIENASQFASKVCTERATFKEMARAAEGVVRDLINIFSHAFFDSKRRGRDSIDRKAVQMGARKWFEQDKSNHLDETLNESLRNIVDNVIGKRKSKSFMIPKHLEKHPIIQRLFDARVLHLMQRGYADKDNPGSRYNIYSLDYGTYVDLLGTSKQPDIDLTVEGGGEELVVPFDDKRSIRRIILNECDLAV